MLPNPLKYNFSGKVALITGISSSSIGSSIAAQFARYGASVAITGNNPKNLKMLSQKIQQFSPIKPLEIVGDLRDESFRKLVIEQTMLNFGQLNCLVNTIGGEMNSRRTLRYSNLMDDFDEAYKLDLRSVIQLTQLAVPYLEKTQGSVFNISSPEAIQSFGASVCRSFKEALEMITKTLALELGTKGIRVNSINSGFTEKTNSNGLSKSRIDQIDQSIFANQSSRVEACDDIANWASLLASDDALNVTGSSVNYDQLMYIHKW